MITSVRQPRKLKTDFEVEKFVDCIVLPENKDMTIQDICKINEINPVTLYSKLRHLEIRKLIKDKLELFAFMETPAVYRALIARAKTGNTSAIELFLARFEGFRKIDANQIQVIVNPDEEKRRKEAVLNYLDSVKSNRKAPNLKDNDEVEVVVSDGYSIDSNEVTDGTDTHL